MASELEKKNWEVVRSETDEIEAGRGLWWLARGLPSSSTSARAFLGENLHRWGEMEAPGCTKEPTVTDTKRLRSGTYRLIREPYLVERSSRSSAGHGSCPLSLSLSCPLSLRLPRFRPTRTPSSSLFVSPACEKEKKPRPVEIGSSRKILRLGTPTSGKVRKVVTWRTRMPDLGVG